MRGSYNSGEIWLLWFNIWWRTTGSHIDCYPLFERNQQKRFLLFLRVEGLHRSQSSILHVRLVHQICLIFLAYYYLHKASSIEGCTSSPLWNLVKRISVKFIERDKFIAWIVRTQHKPSSLLRNGVSVICLRPRMFLYLCRTINSAFYLLDPPCFRGMINDVPNLTFSQSGLCL